MEAHATPSPCVLWPAAVTIGCSTACALFLRACSPLRYSKECPWMLTKEPAPCFDAFLTALAASRS